MTEARIECLCNHIRLPDLNLGFQKGAVVYVDAAKARGSNDLQRAWRAKAVGIKYVERFRTKRSASPLIPVSVIPSPVSQVIAPEEPDGGYREVPIVDLDAIAARVTAELARQVEALEERLVARITKAVLIGIQAGGSVVSKESVVNRMPVMDDVPVYVPSRIDGPTAELGLKSQRAEGTVDDAATALREARGRGRKDR